MDRFAELTGISDVRVLYNYRKGQTLPPFDLVTSMARELFGLDETHKAAKKAFLAAWKHAEANGAEQPPQFAADWPRDNPQPFTELAELELLTPQADNAGGYYLRARLVVGARADESVKPPVLLALREAFLSVDVPANLVTDGSLVGVREAHENLREAPGGLRVVGPLARTQNGNEAGYLEGEVLGGHHLAVLTSTADATEAETETAVTVRLSVPRRSFVVTPLDAEGNASIHAVDSPAKQAVLDALIFSALERDQLGRAVLQKAKLRMRPRT
ncbi:MULTISPECIES: hypothetical protein [Roseomonadaceae]|uniref:Uncharacterized protein n=1 Tax=Falsiroseomonas oleicola TaxID=2801474 RepID=A0ABS6H892_9PROT|nr:hypothetical protein [Roseomonas oleicola]MBU8544922.1 hypothetical protein [Roseomonas oleicola]